MLLECRRSKYKYDSPIWRGQNSLEILLFFGEWEHAITSAMLYVFVTRIAYQLFSRIPICWFLKKRRRRWWLNLCINSVFFPLRADQTFFYATCYFRKFVEEIKSKELQQKNSMTRLCDVIISVKHT